jgi:hypothetical protein
MIVGREAVGVRACVVVKVTVNTLAAVRPTGLCVISTIVGSYN